MSHLQYADDTILVMENDEDSFIAIKFLLYCYEEMSGLKINYQKSEVMGVGISLEEQDRIANIFNCNVGSFPLKYLGLPVSHIKLSSNDLDFVPKKVEKRLENGFNAQASSGARSVIIDACLDSIPTYAMGFYLLYEGNHLKMDMARARFFWEGVGDKKKYHMVHWEDLSRPKDFEIGRAHV